MKSPFRNQKGCNTPWVGPFFLLLISVFRVDTVLAEDVDIKAVGCDDLDIEETKRLVRIELSEIAKTGSGRDRLVVRFECDADTVNIYVMDGVTDRSVERSIDQINQNVKERVVALSTSQLIAVSRMESTKPEEQEQGQGQEQEQEQEQVELNAIEPENNRSQTRKSVVLGSSSLRVKHHLKESDLFLTGGIRLRSKLALAAGTAGLKSDLLFTPHIGIMFLAEFEAGSTTRDAGEVTTIAAFWGIGFVGRFFRRHLFFFETGLEALMGYAYLKGNPKTWASGKSAGGITGEFALRAAPTIKLDSVLLSIVFKGGYTLENPVGTVTDEDDVTIGGFWMGVDFCLGLDFLASKSRNAK